MEQFDLSNIIFVTKDCIRFNEKTYNTPKAWSLIQSMISDLEVGEELPSSSEENSTFKGFLNVPITLDIYTDGSHKKHSPKGGLGIGVYCKYDDIEYKLSKTIDQELLLSYDIPQKTIDLWSAPNEFPTFGRELVLSATETECSNPTAEYVALAETLKILKICPFNSNSVIRIYSDYEGVQKWTNGIWQAKKPYIIKIRDYVQKSIKEMGCTVELIHVKGHSNIYGNEQADKLASIASDGIKFDSNFCDLVEALL